jgi:hypothetical protein
MQSQRADGADDERKGWIGEKVAGVRGISLGHLSGLISIEALRQN